MSEKMNVEVAQNVDVVQQAYEAFGRGDIPGVLELLTDDVEWTMQGPSMIPFAGTFRGREGIAEGPCSTKRLSSSSSSLASSSGKATPSW